MCLRNRIAAIGLFVAVLCVPRMAFAAKEQSINSRYFVPLAQWWVSVDDRMITDTDNDISYLLKRSGEFTAFRSGSGKKEFVSYANRYYNAQTPEDNWVALSREIQNDPNVFGPRKIFFRLFAENGKVQTLYGIHTVRNQKELLARQDRKKSMGCILVAESVLDIIDETFAMNDNSLHVTTINGVPPMFADESVRNLVSKL